MLGMFGLGCCDWDAMIGTIITLRVQGVRGLLIGV